MIGAEPANQRIMLWVNPVGKSSRMLYDVRMIGYSFDEVDTRIVLWIVNHWHRNLTCDVLFITLSEWTPIVMMGVIASAGFGLFLGAAAAHAAVLRGVSAVVAAVGGRILNEPLSKVFHRDRPFHALGIAPLVQHQPGDSFPSNHATGAFALAVSMASVPGYGALLLILASLLALSRVYVGVHYATDVLTGAINGWLCAVLAWWLLESLHIPSMLSAW